MNALYGEMNKLFQKEIKKESTYPEGIKDLLKLRETLFTALLAMKSELSPEKFSLMPFPKAKGYHNKTIAYSLYHVFRIEDIVAHTLIKKSEEIFFSFVEEMNSPIITTGNELEGEGIIAFSKALNLDALFRYMDAVKKSGDELIKGLRYNDLKKKFGEEDERRIREAGVVDISEDWLIPYWCHKDIEGLLKMPFSRHWINHIEASLRIKEKISPSKKQ